MRPTQAESGRPAFSQMKVGQDLFRSRQALLHVFVVVRKHVDADYAAQQARHIRHEKSAMSTRLRARPVSSLLDSHPLPTTAHDQSSSGIGGHSSGLGQMRFANQVDSLRTGY